MSDNRGSCGLDIWYLVFSTLQLTVQRVMVDAEVLYDNLDLDILEIYGKYTGNTNGQAIIRA